MRAKTAYPVETNYKKERDAGMVFNDSAFDAHEQVCFFHDQETNLKAIIAIHNTNLGPALGGCRAWSYASEDEALRDVLRLSRGMTYKAAMAKLPLGGGKSVIMLDANTPKTPAMIAAMGRCVERLKGLYITAEDVGTTVADMEIMHEHTKHVYGASRASGGSGDPSPFTALGAVLGIEACVRYSYKKDNMNGLSAIVQGLGNVGRHLCEFLHERGVKLYVSDIQQPAVNAMVKTYGATPLDAENVFKQEADIFVPCALGGIINQKTIPTLNVRIVAGSANNQLDTAEDGEKLKSRGILYAPDYILNAGGLINVWYEGPGYEQVKAVDHIKHIPETLLEVFAYAEKHNMSTSSAADLIAEERFMAKSKGNVKELRK